LGASSARHREDPLFVPAKGTIAWKSRVRVNSSKSRVTVPVRSIDHDGLVSNLAIVKALQE
jgi:hypothetical protein